MSKIFTTFALAFETLPLMIKKKQPLVSKQRAIELAINTNGITREMAERYTDSELREVVKLLKLKPNF